MADDLSHSTLAIRSRTGTGSNVAANASAVTLLAANQNVRLGATFYNDSATATCFLSCFTGPTLSAYTVPIPPKSFYVLDMQYDGVIQGIWDIANGTLHITEFT